MKWPKLKHPTLCQLILYAPVLWPFCVMAVVLFVPEQYQGWLTALYLGGMVLSLIPLFRFAMIYIMSDMVFGTLRAWKKDRIYYPLKGSTEHWEKRLLRKLGSYGKSGKVVPLQPQPLLSRRKVSMAWTVFHKGIVRHAQVYRVGHLNRETYMAVMRAAVANGAQSLFPAQKPIFVDRQQKKAPMSYSGAVFIVADSADPEAADWVRQRSPGERFPLLPCVLDCGAGKCCFDALTEYYALGQMPKPDKNFAVKLIRRTVYPMGLPQGDPSTMTPPPEGMNPEQSMWEYLKPVVQANHELFGVAFNWKDRWITRKLQPKSCMFHRGWLYARLVRYTAKMQTQTDLNDAKNIRVILPQRWSLPKTKRLSKQETGQLKAQVHKFLTEQGYNVFFAEEE